MRRVRGVKTRRSSRIDGTTLRGIPITTVPRTLVDIAPESDEEELALACHRAGVRYRTAPKGVKAVLARRPNAPEAGKLRAIMSGDVKVTQSKLEKRGLAIVEEERFPLPETNRPAGTRRVDFRWPEHKLTVELDGYEFHKSRHAWEQDRKREREAYARGDDFRRYTYGDVFEDSRAMRRELRTLLPGI
jgi:very-short-patch-repair endonuclease